MAMKIMVTPIKTCSEQHSLLPQGLLLFVFLPLKGNQITPIKTCSEQHSLLPQGLLLFVFLPLKGNQTKQ
jgi:hypothetical protein